MPLKIATFNANSVRSRLPVILKWLAAERPGFRFTPVFSEPGSGEAAGERTGLVHEALAADYPDLSGHDVYMAGPPPMIEAARSLFPRHGLVAERLFFDSFDYAQPRGDTPV